MTDAATAFELSPPPRPLVPKVRRRSWAEPTVRFWWLLALALLILAPIVGAGSVQRWQTISKLVEQPPAKAKLLRTDREDLVGRPIPPGAPVQIQVGQGEEARTLQGTLEGWSKGPLPRLGDVIDVRLDPTNPAVWTVVDQAPSLASALLTGISVAVVAMIPFVIALLLRRRVLQCWKNGEVRTASVVSRQQTALAPSAVALRCAWMDAGSSNADRAIFSVFVQKRLAPADGTEIDVLTPPSGGKCVAADWFRS